jgi:hypothetical protein
MALADGTALLLYGRVGSYTRRAADTPVRDRGSLALWRNCADSINRNVVAPWRSVGHLDVFIQSWNQEMADDMDAYWQPAASWHGVQNTSFRCPAGSTILYCERTWWAMLGMRHAIELRSAWARAEESSDGTAARLHGTVIMMRHDLFWFNELPVVRASINAVRLWLPFRCQTRHVRPPRHSSTPTNMEAVTAAPELWGHKCGIQRPSLGFCDLLVDIDW